MCPSVSAQPLPGLHLALLTPLSERGGTPALPLTFPKPSSALPFLRRSPLISSLLSPLVRCLVVRDPRVRVPHLHAALSFSRSSVSATLREWGAREPGFEGERGPTASPALSRKDVTIQRIVA